VTYLSGTITMVASTGTVTFSQAFGSAPIVTATPEANDQCYISTAATTTAVGITCGSATTKVDWTAVLAK